MHRSSWRAPLAASGGVALVVVGLRAGGVLTDRSSPVPVGILMGLAAAVVGLRRGPRPSSILLIGASTMAFAATALIVVDRWAHPSLGPLAAIGAVGYLIALVLASAAMAAEAGTLIPVDSRTRAMVDSFTSGFLVAALGWNILLISGRASHDTFRGTLGVLLLILLLGPTALAAAGVVNDPTDTRFHRLAIGFGAAVLAAVAGLIGSGHAHSPAIVEPAACFAATYLVIAFGTRSDGVRPAIDVAARLRRRRRATGAVQALYIASLITAMFTSTNHTVMGLMTIAVLVLMTATETSSSRENVRLHRRVAAQLQDLADSEDRFRHLAWTDELTGLMNRRAFVERLTSELERGRGCAVLFVDLDRFKEVNDTLGHEAGDELLVTLAHRLRETLQGTAEVARFGGDEFIVLLPRARGNRSAVACAERILRAMSQPVELRDGPTFVAASIGAVVSSVSSTPARLLSDADAAMYEAKSQGRNRVVVFSSDLGERIEERARIANELHRAVEVPELVVHFQPIVRLADGALKGFAALVRLDHPERGLIAPGLFLDVADDTGQIVPIGAYVLRTACAQLAQWRRGGLVSAETSIAVNLAPRQLADPGVVALVADILVETALPAANLVLEITESALMHEGAHVDEAVANLGELGVKFSVDDFGTGYSSLTYLKRFPVHVLKVDRDFVDGLPNERGDSVIVDAVVGLAKGMGFHCVAEGVETTAQAEYLRSIGCSHGQGYLFAKPMPSPEVEQWLAADARQLGLGASSPLS